MSLDYEVFEHALTLFHHYSLQNSETVRWMQEQGVLPTSYRRGFAVLDIGAGQGHLPSLMEPYTGTLVLVEPNPRCVQVLQTKFRHVYPCPWGDPALQQLQADHPQGFDLITMSHMLYHLRGLADVREKIRMALTVLKPAGSLVIILNQPAAPMALLGIAFQVAESRRDEAATNQDLHVACHAPPFFEELAGPGAAVAIYPIATPLHQVESREELVALLRMCLLNPLSEAPCATARLDAFITDYLDANHPALTWPATIASHDDLIIIRKPVDAAPAGACATSDPHAEAGRPFTPPRTPHA